MLPNSEDLDEMPHKAVFHQGLQYIAKDKQEVQRRKKQYDLKIIASDPFIYSMDYPKVYCIKEGRIH